MIYLITGLPGAGKTLYCLSQVIPKIVAPGGRRLIVGGVSDLLIEHEPMTVPLWDPEAAVQRLDDRAPSEPPLDVETRADTWWQWCRPGDLIVIDEAQRLFRPMASGRRLPGHIAKLETHRHYGIDLVLITQHPQLLHANVRALIGSHQDVRRLFGTHNTVVYTWDHCTNPDRRASAQKAIVRHDKSVFKLYKSAEVHHKPKVKIPAVILLFPLVLVAAAFLIWRAVQAVAPAAPPVPSIPVLVSSASAPGVSASSPAVAGVCLVERGQCLCASPSASWRVPLADPACRSPGLTYQQLEVRPGWLTVSPPPGRSRLALADVVRSLAGETP